MKYFVTKSFDVHSQEVIEVKEFKDDTALVAAIADFEKQHKPEENEDAQIIGIFEGTKIAYKVETEIKVRLMPDLK